MALFHTMRSQTPYSEMGWISCSVSLPTPGRYHSNTSGYQPEPVAAWRCLWLCGHLWWRFSVWVILSLLLCQTVILLPYKLSNFHVLLQWLQLSELCGLSANILTVTAETKLNRCSFFPPQFSSQLWVLSCWKAPQGQEECNFLLQEL